MNGSIWGHNPYFNRWFSAIRSASWDNFNSECHNPYFNRWFSAISIDLNVLKANIKVTILILIDGFLQSRYRRDRSIRHK